MKRKLLFILSSILLLSGCGNKGENLTIISPVGAPSLAFYNYASDENYVTNSSPNNIKTSMTENGNDVVVIDTITGLKAIDSGAPYKLACNITFGNFYLASTGNDDNDTLDKTDIVVIFGQNLIPDILFSYLYGNDYNVRYVDAVGNAGKCLTSGNTLDGKEEVDYVFVAEPVLTSALANNSKAKVYANIQDVYKEKTDGKELIQAGLFIKDSTDMEDADAFLKRLSNDIDKLIEDSELLTANNKVDDETFKDKYGIAASVAKATIKNNNRIGLGFKLASENKENIKEFCKLFGYNLNEEKIY